MNKRMIALTFFAPALLCLAADDVNKRFTESTSVLQEMAGAGDKSVPKSLVDKAACIVVVPSLKKGGFIVAGQYGNGFSSCKNKTKWSAPLGMRMEGGSFGLQAGGQSADIILLVMNEKGMDRLVSSKFTLGGEASVAAGPVGRDAEAMTDATMKAEILSYSRAQGVFGGISLKGSTLRPDEDTNKKLYGDKADPRAILTGKVPPPPAAAAFLGKLGHYGAPAAKK